MLIKHDAINSIIEVKEESDIDSLFKGGGTSALVSAVSGLDDFEFNNRINCVIKQGRNLRHLPTVRSFRIKLAVKLRHWLVHAPAKQAQRILEYRRVQLERLQQEVVDIEEMSGGISIMDLGLNEFCLDVHEYPHFCSQYGQSGQTAE